MGYFYYDMLNVSAVLCIFRANHDALGIRFVQVIFARSVMFRPHCHRASGPINLGRHPPCDAVERVWHTGLQGGGGWELLNAQRAHGWQRATTFFPRRGLRRPQLTAGLLAQPSDTSWAGHIAMQTCAKTRISVSSFSSSAGSPQMGLGHMKSKAGSGQRGRREE